MRSEQFRAYQLEWQRKRRAERKTAGLCVHCGAPTATETMCEKHRADTQAASNVYYESPHGRMVKVQQNARIRKRQRVQQGFQSTRTGQAAIAAYYTTNREGGNGEI